MFWYSLVISSPLSINQRRARETMNVYYNCIVHLPTSFGILKFCTGRFFKGFTKMTYGAARLLLRRVVKYSERQIRCRNVSAFIIILILKFMRKRDNQKVWIPAQQWLLTIMMWQKCLYCTKNCTRKSTSCLEYQDDEPNQLAHVTGIDPIHGLLIRSDLWHHFDITNSLDLATHLPGGQTLR